VSVSASRETFTEGSQGNKVWDYVRKPPLAPFPSVLVFSIRIADIHRFKFLQKATKETKVGITFGTLRCIPFCLVPHPKADICCSKFREDKNQITAGGEPSLSSFPSVYVFSYEQRCCGLAGRSNESLADRTESSRVLAGQMSCLHFMMQKRSARECSLGLERERV